MIRRVLLLIQQIYHYQNIEAEKVSYVEFTIYFIDLKFTFFMNLSFCIISKLVKVRICVGTTFYLNPEIKSKSNPESLNSINKTVT